MPSTFLLKTTPDAVIITPLLWKTLMLTSSSNTGGEGFNWSDNFRSRAERTSSIAGGGLYGYNGSPPGSLKHDRSKSVAVMEPPMRDIPKPKEQVRPDHFQERILKGDFYMD